MLQKIGPSMNMLNSITIVVVVVVVVVLVLNAGQLTSMFSSS